MKNKRLMVGMGRHGVAPRRPCARDDEDEEGLKTVKIKRCR